MDQNSNVNFVSYRKDFPTAMMIVSYLIVSFLV